MADPVQDAGLRRSVLVGRARLDIVSVRSPARAMTISLEPKELELLAGIMLDHWRKMLPRPERAVGMLMRKVVGED
jgi:hypothetical protein